MPRRNFFIIIAAITVSLVCHHRSGSGRLTAAMMEAYSEIDRHYVEEVEPESLMEGALEGMVGTLDQYSSYISPEQYQAFREGMDQEFGGVGIQVNVDPETERLMVVSPLVGTPAYKAGILPGDIILQIEGISTEGVGLQKAVEQLRGAPGEPVRMTVLHKDSQQREDIILKRDIIEVESVLGDSRKPDGSWNFFLEGYDRIGYVRVNAFNEKTISELGGAIDELIRNGLKGLVIDLRDNPGGLLTAAVQTCNMFVKDGVIVSTRGRGGALLREYSATPADTFSGFPVAVLVNEFSASASEIVAACLQDYNEACIVGERTWGKGSVQNVIPLPGGGSALKLTIAYYWRPSGRNIHRRQDAEDDDEWGVRPNEGYVVELTKEEREEMRRRRRARDIVHPDGRSDDPDSNVFIDPQLKRALDYLLEHNPQGKKSLVPAEAGPAS